MAAMYSMPPKGYGKGVPPSGVMMGTGMPMGSMGVPMGKGFGKGYEEAAREDSLWDRFFGGNDEDDAAPVTRVQQVPMMPIPWQTEKEPLSEKAHAGFDNLSLEQLQAMALTRQKTIEGLEREIKEHIDNDQKHEDRLAKLEEQFDTLAQGSELKFKAPLLTKIRKAVRDSHLLDHEMEMAKMKDYSDDAAAEWRHLDPWKYIHAQNLVLGRGCLALDQHYIEKMKFKEKLERDQHPVVNRVHYAGHVSKPAEDVESIFVKESGVYKKQPLHPAPYRNQFWLNLDGPTREDEVKAREAAKEAAEDPVARRVTRHDEAGKGEDAKPEDWLGMLKHGEMIDEKPPPNPGFVMPSWMY